MFKTAILCLIAIGLGVTAYTLVTLSEAWADDGSAITDAGPGSGSGSAVTPAPLPNPLEQPGEAISVVTKLWRSGAITSALIVAAFLALTVLRAKVAWLGVGYRAALMAAAVGGLGTLADAIQRGLTPNVSMMVVAMTTALALFFTPKPKTETAPSA